MEFKKRTLRIMNYYTEIENPVQRDEKKYLKFSDCKYLFNSLQIHMQFFYVKKKYIFHKNNNKNH